MPKVIAVTSDTHCRSTVGLISPSGVVLDDEGTYHPSKAQRWLWENWKKGWQMVEGLMEKHKCGMYWINNGDLVDGDHHGTYQIVSKNPIAEREIVRDVIDVPLDLGPEKIFLVRGTESHVGGGASSEESIARALSDDWPIATDEKNYSWWHLMMEVEGVYIDALHHGRTGYRPWTHANATILLAAQITMERFSGDERVPDLAIRSHFHRISDSYDAHRCRVIQTPAFQLASAYVYKRVPETLADIGMIAIVVDDGSYEVHKSVTKAKRGRIWKA